MRKPIEDYTDPTALRTIMANAKRLGDNDIWRRAFRRLCKLEGFDQTDSLHRDLYETPAAYELLLTEKNGRTTKESRTRQKLKKKEDVQCLEGWAISKAPTEGFVPLIEHGLVELTGEYLVLKYPAHCSTLAVAAARTRLDGLVMPSLPP